MDCEKVKFSTKEFADFHIEKNKEANKAKCLIARSYLCKCSSWHITSKPLISVVISELNTKIEDLETDNIALKEQLVEQIKRNVDLKAEIEVLKRFKHKLHSEPQDIKIIKHKLNVAKTKITEQQKQICILLNKLEQCK